LLDRGNLAIIGREDHSIHIYRLAPLKEFATIKDILGSDNVRNLQLTKDGRFLVQFNNDGQLYVYSVSDQKRILSGISVDDEVVVYTDDGFYDGTTEGGRYVYRYFTGLGQYHKFNQFASRFYRPDLIQAILRGENPPHPSPEIVAPPTVELELIPQPHPGELIARLRVTSDADLKTLRFFVDGTPFDEIALSGRSAELDRAVSVAEGIHWVTAAAYNALGFSSIPKSAMARGEAGAVAKGKLFYVGVAVDQYVNYPQLNLDGSINSAFTRA
jgi:hypothetical protein